MDGVMRSRAVALSSEKLREVGLSVKTGFQSLSQFVGIKRLIQGFLRFKSRQSET